MAEFKFYGCDEDFGELVSAVLAPRGNVLTPDIEYLSKQYPSFSSVQALETCASPNRQYFVTGRFTLEPLTLIDVSTDDEQPAFTVALHSSYQAFSLSLPSTRHCMGKILLGPGLLHLPRAYFSEEFSAKPDEPTREAYEDVKRTLKSRLVTKRVNQHRLLITKRAKELLDANKALILVQGWWLDNSGEKVWSNLKPLPDGDS
jgi:hypothetical protein